MIVILTLIFVLALIGLAAWGGFIFIRKNWREQKNYERGLKMVPLLIHLPPRSTDTEVGGRDERDVNDETISKAQTLYNIIASSYKKGFKNDFYGQRHFGFEIVATGGFVKFYATVPISLVDLVQQAITSAYPTARLEEVHEHNIFSEVGKANGVVGGEMVLKEDSSQPVATFQEMKRDSMQSILNSLSGMEKEDGAAIQILMRPSHHTWRKEALAKAEKKRKGKESKGGVSSKMSGWFGDVIYAPFKPPEEREVEKKTEDKSLSGSEQALVDAIEEKARHATFETQIRIIASSNLHQRSQSLFNTIQSSFSLFESPGRNGFKVKNAKDIDDLITAYILRFFPQDNTKTVLNSVELASIFHFPDQNSIPTTQLERQMSKQTDGPRNVPNAGTMLGYNIFRGTKKKINLDPEDRRRHIYAVGQTGTGKSTYLENLAVQDMLDGTGFAFIDPHGDTAEKLLSMVPKERAEDVIYFSPADMDYPLGLNLFEHDNEDQKDFIIQETISMLYKLYDPQRQGIIGPRFERIFTNSAQLLMADPDGGTFIDVPKLLVDPAYMKSKLKYIDDENVLDFWTKEWPASQRSNDAGEVTSWVVSKFGAFQSNAMMRNIIGQEKSSFNMSDIMNNRKILLVNLSKGRLGELNSKLLGMIFVMKFQAAAMGRANIPEDQREDFALYVDEFQNFSTDSFASILSEARKYRLNLVVSNQFTTQLTDEIRDAVFGNVGTIICFRVGTQDAEFLAKQFAPTFDMDDLQRIPNFNAVVRMLIHGVPTPSFSMAALPPLGNPNKELGDALQQLSAAKYGRPRAVVEKEIFDRIRTATPTPAAGGAGAAGAPPAVAKPGSFLDSWLDKKSKTSPPVTPAGPPGGAPRPVVQQQPMQNQSFGSQFSSPQQNGQPASMSASNPSIQRASQQPFSQPPQPNQNNPNTPQPHNPAQAAGSVQDQPNYSPSPQQFSSSSSSVPPAPSSEQQPLPPAPAEGSGYSNSTESTGRDIDQDGHTHIDVNSDGGDDHSVSLR